MVCQIGARRCEFQPRRADRAGIGIAVPRPHEPPDGARGRPVRGSPCSGRGRRSSLREVRRFRLRVDVPGERSRRPLRADDRILAAHEVDVAGPQQPVVVVLADERNRVQAQPAANQRRPPACGTDPPAQASSAPTAVPSGTAQTIAAIAVGPGVEERRAARHSDSRTATRGSSAGAASGMPSDAHNAACAAASARNASRLRKRSRSRSRPRGRGRESRKPEPARERQSRMARSEPVGVVDPGLGAQILEDEPCRRVGPRGHRGEIGVREPAAEGLDDDIGRVRRRATDRSSGERSPRTRAARRRRQRCRARCARAPRAGRPTASPRRRAPPTSWRASRHDTPASPKLSTTLQKMSQRRGTAVMMGGGTGHYRARACTWPNAVAHDRHAGRRQRTRATGLIQLKARSARSEDDDTVGRTLRRCARG